MFKDIGKADEFECALIHKMNYNYVIFNFSMFLVFSVKKLEKLIQSFFIFGIIHELFIPYAI